VGLKDHNIRALQTCSFALSGVVPHDQVITQIEASIENLWTKGHDAMQQNFADARWRVWPFACNAGKHEGEYAALLWYEWSGTEGS